MPVQDFFSRANTKQTKILINLLSLHKKPNSSLRFCRTKVFENLTVGIAIPCLVGLSSCKNIPEAFLDLFCTRFCTNFRLSHLDDNTVRAILQQISLCNSIIINKHVNDYNYQKKLHLVWPNPREILLCILPPLNRLQLN